MGVRRITAKFEIVTPMFLGGAEYEASRIRGTAVKGALAFWWRALNFARFVEEQGGDANKALEAMRTRERTLFGSSQKGQGAFLLRVKDKELKTIDPPAQMRMKDGGLKGSVVGVGARYLGYGLVNAFHTKANPAKNKPEKKGGQLERNCFAAGQLFSLELVFRPNADTADIKEIIEALKLFGLLGGLGARVRRGWGSLALTSLKAENLPEGVDAAWQAPESREDYIARLKELFTDHPLLQQSGTDWRLTAFARESRIWVANEKENFGLSMLDKLGRAMLNYRAMGRGGATAVGGQAILRQFVEDHDWFRKAHNGVDIPYRSAFGLPHMYDSLRGEGVTVAGKESDRRASPLMFHIHNVGHEAVGLLTLIPTAFLGNGLQIQATRRKGVPRQTKRAYDLSTPYGAKNASGLDVLQDFVGAGSSHFTPNQVVSFTQVLP